MQLVLDHTTHTRSTRRAATWQATLDQDDYQHTQDLGTPIGAVRRNDTLELSAEPQADQNGGNGAIPAIGSVIRNRYVLEEIVGEGGFASVYRARDLRRDDSHGSNQVALKFLRPELRDRATAVARLKREFMQSSGLLHPNIVRMFDLDAQDDTWFIVMELLHGETLASRLNRLQEQPLSPEQAIATLAACADALDYMHRKCIAHGDFKPSNVLLLDDGGIRIIDLGNSADPNSIDPNASSSGGHVATPAYSSPQVLARTLATPSDDIFSFACVAFEVLTGTHPFTGRSCLDLQGGDAAIESTLLSTHQLAVIKQGLAREPADRPASVMDFFHALIAPEARAEAEAAPDDAQPAVEQPPQPDVSAGISLSDIPLVHISLAPVALAEISAAIERATEPATEPAPVQTLPAAAPASVIPAGPPAAAVITTPVVKPAAKPIAHVTAPLVSRATRQPQPSPVARPTQSQRMLAAAALPWRTLAAYSLLSCLLFYAGFVLNSYFFKARPAAEQVQAATPARTTPISAAAPTPAVQAPAINAPTNPSKVAPTTTPPTSTVSFEAPRVMVTERASAAVAILKRAKGSGRARVRWSIRNGAAQAGRDFSGPTSGVAEFGEFQQVRAVYVPLINNPARSGDRDFIIELSNLSQGVAIAPIGKVRVTIVDSIRTDAAPTYAAVD